MILPEASEVESWLTAYLSGRRKRLKIDVPVELEPALIGRFPHLQGRPERWKLLGVALEYVEQAGVIRFDRKERNRFQRSSSFVPLIAYVINLKGAKPARAQFAWHPKLASAVAVRDQRQLEKLEKINSWLVHSEDVQASPVSLQERSLEIFGADKVLTSINIKLPDGTLVDEHFLGAYKVEPPLAYETPVIATTSTIGLIIENPATFDAFSTWNDKTGEYAVVVCGEGNRITGSPRRLKKIAERHQITEWQYFGDIDPEGLRIAVDVADAAERIGDVPVRPCQPAYRWLARNGHSSQVAAKTKDETALWEEVKVRVAAWHPVSLLPYRAGETVSDLTYIPQEWLSLAILQKCSTLQEIGRYRLPVAKFSD